MENSNAAGAPKKPRSRLACQRCHDRRVRCDAYISGLPCSHCKAASLGGACRLIESRRVRGARGRFSARPQPDLASKPLASPWPTPQPCRDEVIAASSTSETTAEHQSGEATECPGQLRGGSVGRDRDSNATPATATTGSSGDTTIGPTAVADQWSKIISTDMLLVPDSGRMTYLGEAWHLSYMVQWKSHGGPTSIGNSNNNSDGNTSRRLPGFQPASTVTSSPSDSDSFTTRSVHVPMPSSREDTPAAAAQRSATAPPPAPAILENQLSVESQRALVDAYCTHHLTLYPIMDEQKFRAEFDCKTVSPMLLSAVLVVGAIHAPDSVIYRSGFDSRQTILRKLYIQSKALFFEDDIDAKFGNQLVRVQTAFLLHHNWFNPNSTMDCWTWMSMAVRLAQNMGMHRSTVRSSLRPDDQKLWKRIWWSFYSRDSQLASALGKPLIINDIDCDVERLTLEDFEEHHSLEARLFVIEQAKLADECKYLMQSRFVPRSTNLPMSREQKAGLMQRLEAWKSGLPEQLSFQKKCDPEQESLQALLLEILYSNMLLLIHRPQFKPGDQGTSVENDAGSWKAVFAAASNITHITELIMNYKSLYQCPLFYTTALFGAMLMHVIRGPAAEHQLNLCMIATRTMAAMYSNMTWVRNIFQKLGEKKRRADGAQQQQQQQQQDGPPRWAAGSPMQATSAACPQASGEGLPQQPFPLPLTAPTHNESWLAHGALGMAQSGGGGLGASLSSSSMGLISGNDDVGGFLPVVSDETPGTDANLFTSMLFMDTLDPCWKEVFGSSDGEFTT